MCKESPAIKELAEIMGSSHQNVKQILLKLEKKGFVNIFEGISEEQLRVTIQTIIKMEENLKKL